jgi:aminotransferase
MKISRRADHIPPSGIREFFELVIGMKDVISLGVGEPDFTTPWNIREKAIFSLEEGLTSYTSNKGLLALRRAVSLSLKEKYGVKYNPESEILITVGVSEGVDLAFRALLNPGDSVIIVSPHYVSYPALVELADGVPVFLETRFSEGFKINFKKLYSLSEKNKPKAIIINYPNNPTGVSYTEPELIEILNIARKFNMVVISDEIYDGLVYSFPHKAFSSLPRAKKDTLLLGGVSKQYAMTGFRVGWACGNEKIISALTKIHQYSMLCAPIISQFASKEALRGTQTEIERMKREHRRRRDFIVSGLNALGLKCVMPDGAFYCFCSLHRIKQTGMDFAKKLLQSQRVAVVPGEAFGEPYRDFIRISYSQPIDILKEALSKMKEFIGQIK